jgi:hypothetical protein
MGSISILFHDAITVCKRLSIQYLWVNTFCIIQDDEFDWLREASKMKDI